MWERESENEGEMEREGEKQRHWGAWESGVKFSFNLLVSLERSKGTRNTKKGGKKLSAQHGTLDVYEQ